MLHLHLSVYSGADSPQWHVQLGSVPFHEQIGLSNLTHTDITCDLNELRRTIRAGGIFRLFTCCCGSVACKAFHVEVTHTGDELVWNRVFADEDGSVGKSMMKVNWRFKRVEYEQTVQRAIEITEFTTHNQHYV